MCYVKPETSLPAQSAAPNYANMPSAEAISLNQFLLGLTPAATTSMPLLTSAYAYPLSFPQMTNPNCLSPQTTLDSCGSIDMKPMMTFTALPQQPTEPVEKEDELAIRRKRNTEAARRSRQRKQEKMECMNAEVNKLEKEKRELQVEVGVLRRECELYAQRERDLISRVRELENRMMSKI